MKSFILIASLAALTVCNEAAFVSEEAILYEDEGIVYREDIAMYQKGDIRSTDIVFYQHTCNLPGIPGTVQHEDVRYRGNSTTRITGFLMNSPPAQYHVGQLGTSHLTIRATSAPGEGIFTTFQFYGHFTDWV